MKHLPLPVHFEWDSGNRDKNWAKHAVSREEAEQIFLDPQKRSYPDVKHSQAEPRKMIVGKTATGRLLLVIYTIRRDKVRVISARDLNKYRERDLYEKAA
ncbi:MAG: BrnT family toxin [Anaerolineae bacterium]|nr:BrnT family toxin [Anaerolineae bacterium]